MKKRLVLVVFFITFLSVLQLPGSASPIGLSFREYSQFPGSEVSVTGFRLSLISSRHQDVYGLDLGPLALNTVDQSMRGIQLGLRNDVQRGWGIQTGLLYSVVRDDFTGLQLGTSNGVRGFYSGIQLGGFNGAPDGYGIQTGGINVVGGHYDGLQLSGINWVGTGRGLQVGGVNIADEYTGLQVGGVVGSGEVTGFQAGLLTVVREGNPVPALGLINLNFQQVIGFQPGAINYTAELPGFQLGGLNITGEQQGFQGGGMNFTDELQGFQVGGLNWGDEVTGLQLGGINAVEESTGSQIGFFNGTMAIHGFQFGAGNYSLRPADLQVGGINFLESINEAPRGSKKDQGKVTAEGFQLGLYNHTNRSLVGTQVGAVNYGGDLKGYQFGLINVADDLEGLQVGLINSRLNEGSGYPDSFPMKNSLFVNWSW